jgi:AraC family transcriptional regulator
MQSAFFGTTIGSTRAGSFTLIETRYAPGDRLPWHAHDTGFLTVVLSGNYRERVADGSHECQGGTLILHAAGERHADEFGDSGGRCLNIVPDLRWYAQMAHLLLGRAAMVKTATGRALALKLYREFHHADDLSALSIEGLLCEVVVEACRSSAATRGRPSWLQDVQRILDARFSERLRMNDIAMSVGVHPTHLARSFRLHYGVTCGDYLRRRRIDYALKRLRGKSSIADIATSAGFADQSHFTRWFTKLTGMRPSEVRRSR